MSKIIQPSIYREWERGFKQSVQKANIAKFIGGRATTVGASDIGGCLRKSYLGKIHNDLENAPLESIIKMERGSIAEEIVAKGLASAGIETFDQVRLTHPDNENYVCHIDFLLKGEDSLHILEVKTTNLQISEPYESWILQVIFQISLLQLNYPGFTITASVLALDLNSGWSEEFPVEYSDMRLHDLVLLRTERLYNAIQNKEEPEPTIQNYCGICSHKMNCPALVNGAVDAKDLPADVITLIAEVKALKTQDKLKKSKEKELKEVLVGIGVGKVVSDDIITSIITNKGRVSFDSKTFQSEHPEQFEKYTKQGQPTTVLKVA
jgi:CRISPR-associated exonuclease Cas4